MLLTVAAGVALSGSTVLAGDWQPASGGKDSCVECCDSCPDVGGNISIGYETEYIFRGVRLGDDSVWADVSYTFSNIPLTVGVWYLSEFGNDGAFGDEADFYASLSLPSVLGFDASLDWVTYTFPTGGSSTHELGISLSRELFAGITFAWYSGHDFVLNNDNGAWYHDASLAKSFTITDTVGLDLTAGAGYSDNYYQQGVSRDSGFNHYYVQAALPVALNCRATLTPYIGYNGTPDGSVADEFGFSPRASANLNDALHGGVSLSVDW